MDSEYIFVNPRTGTSLTKIYNSWSSIIKKAGLDGKPGVDKLRFHDLRVTVVTNLARAGKDMKLITGKPFGPRSSVDRALDS